MTGYPVVVTTALVLDLAGTFAFALNGALTAVRAAQNARLIPTHGGPLLFQSPDGDAVTEQSSPLMNLTFPSQPALQLIYDTAPIGLAFLSPDCRYLQINRRLTEICGISVEDHLGRSVRECVPALAESVENIVQSIMVTGEPVTGIEVAGQRADQTDERSWITYWHPLTRTNRRNRRCQRCGRRDHGAQTRGGGITGE